MKSENYYDTIAKGYNELYKEEQLNKWDIARKYITFSKKDIVLDLGCGTGITIFEIASKSKIVIGLDNSIEMLKQAPMLENVAYVLSDAAKIPFPNKYFDKTVSITVLQDIKNWNPVLKEIKRVTKGEVLITVLKRNKNAAETKRLLLKYFKIKKFIEEDKDFIFLLN